MSAPGHLYDAALERASTRAREWLAALPDKPIPPRQDADGVLASLGGPLPDGPIDPADVIDLLADGVEPGLMAMGSGRFFGWVIGGTLPAALGADWLTSAWDQNNGMRFATPGTAAAEEAAATWVLDLLGLPETADVGFVTGGTMANFTGLAAARQQVLENVGWDLDRLGLSGAPRVRVLVGAERHITIDLALRYLGLGEPQVVPADDQGRISADALGAALDGAEVPTIVCLQAGNLHSGAFDPLGAACDLAHEHGAWVHVDGAFGLWAAASPHLRHLVDGHDGADSWATDAHKTLNVPYDCGIVVVAHPDALRKAMGAQSSYLVRTEGPGDPLEKVPELSRRARGVPVWAALRSLGRSGVVRPRRPLGAQRRRTRQRALPTSTAPRSSTTWCSPRCAPRSVTTATLGRSRRGCWPMGRPGCLARGGATATCSGCRSATGAPTITTSPPQWMRYAVPPPDLGLRPGQDEQPRSGCPSSTATEKHQPCTRRIAY
ncbi:MAG: aminotransferase class V-fold PLP-dependent enzyme [Nocardioidaceae bacterium]